MPRLSNLFLLLYTKQNWAVATGNRAKTNVLLGAYFAKQKNSSFTNILDLKVVFPIFLRAKSF